MNYSSQHKKPYLVTFVELAKSITKKTNQLFLDHLSFLSTLLITFLSLAFFLVVSYPEMFSQSSFFSLRWYMLLVFLGIFSFSYLLSFRLKNSLVEAISVCLQINILVFFSFVYFLSIENRDFYPPSIIILASLIFLVAYNLFDENKLRIYLLVPQVLLFSLQTFSLIEFLTLDRVFFRNLEDNFLQSIFRLDPLFWLVFCALGIALISVFQFKLKSLYANLAFGSAIFFLCFQMSLMINAIGLEFFLYWQKSLVFLIFWNFIFRSFFVISKEIFEPEYFVKTTLSTLYHGVLIIFVFISPLVFKFLLNLL